MDIPVPSGDAIPRQPATKGHASSQDSRPSDATMVTTTPSSLATERREASHAHSKKLA